MQPIDQQLTGTEITRREALRKGLMLGGAVLWTTPMVQAIGITPALASETSSTCCFDITLKVYDPKTGDFVLSDDPDNPVEVKRSLLGWKTINCNCGTHDDSSTPQIEVLAVEISYVLASHGCFANPAGKCTSQDRSIEAPAELVTGTTYGLQATVSGTQGDNSCSDQSNVAYIKVVD